MGAALLTGLFLGGCFTAIGCWNRQRFGSVQLVPVHAFTLDTWTPFRPEWVWVYLAYYPFCFLPLLISSIRNDSEVFTRTLMGFGIQFAVSFLLFIFFPLQVIHPVLPGGIEGKILASLYGFDHGFNSFPSLHVANMTYVSALFLSAHSIRKAWPVVVVAALISVSTMLVKQHYLSDVILGAVLGWISFAIAFHNGWGRTCKNAS